jgi:hypothetical protein
MTIGVRVSGVEVGVGDLVGDGCRVGAEEAVGTTEGTGV